MKYYVGAFLIAAAVLSCLQMGAFVRINYDAKIVSKIEDLMLRATVPMIKRRSLQAQQVDTNYEGVHYYQQEHQNHGERQGEAKSDWINRLGSTMKTDPCMLSSLLEERVQVQPRPKRPCALLFFGFARKFRDIVYPSIQEEILPNNQHCDIFVHTYSDGNSDKEKKKAKYDSNEVYDMTSNVAMDTLEEWEASKNWTYFTQAKFIPTLEALNWVSYHSSFYILLY